MIDIGHVSSAGWGFISVGQLPIVWECFWFTRNNTTLDRFELVQCRKCQQTTEERKPFISTDHHQTHPIMVDSTTSEAPRALQMGAKGAYIVRLLMVGDSACGKTSLVLRFDQNVFSTKFVTTIGVDYRDKMVKVCVCCVYYVPSNAFGEWQPRFLFLLTFVPFLFWNIIKDWRCPHAPAAMGHGRSRAF